MSTIIKTVMHITVLLLWWIKATSMYLPYLFKLFHKCFLGRNTQLIYEVSSVWEVALDNKQQASNHKSSYVAFVNKWCITPSHDCSLKGIFLDSPLSLHHWPLSVLHSHYLPSTVFHLSHSHIWLPPVALFSTFITSLHASCFLLILISIMHFKLCRD